MPSSGAPRPTTFADSIWATATTGTFATALHDYDPATKDADAGYYRNRCRDWSAQHPNKPKVNWIAFAAQIIDSDRSQTKLVTLQQLGHDQHSDNLNSSRPSAAKPRFDLTLSSPAELQAAAERLIARRRR